MAAVRARAITSRHRAVGTCWHTLGMPGAASPVLALWAAPQTRSTVKAMTARAVPQTSGLASLRHSALSSHSTIALPSRGFEIGDLKEPVFESGLFEGHELSDHAAGDQRGVHVAAAVMVDDEPSVLMPAGPTGQQAACGRGVRWPHPDENAP